MPLTPWEKRLIRWLPYAYYAGYETGVYLLGDATDVAHETWGMKLTCSFSRGTTNDRVMTTHHLVNYTAGAPDGTWTGADFALCEARMTTFWTALNALLSSDFSLVEYRWYRFGPTIAAPNPAVRITTLNLGFSGASLVPHQVALSITERCADRKHWGRFYVPAPSVVTGNYVAGGKFANGTCDAVAAAANTMYAGWRTDDFLPVVWSPAKAERPSKGGGALPAQSAVAFSVEQIQVDNVPDVIRRRRPLPTYWKRVP